MNTTYRVVGHLGDLKVKRSDRLFVVVDEQRVGARVAAHDGVTGQTLLDMRNRSNLQKDTDSSSDTHEYTTRPTRGAL